MKDPRGLTAGWEINDCPDNYWRKFELLVLVIISSKKLNLCASYILRNYLRDLMELPEPDRDLRFEWQMECL